jgi:hypothetical protein
MNLSELNIEELVEKRTRLILEGKSTSDINLLIDKKEQEYILSVVEDTSGTDFNKIDENFNEKVIVDKKRVLNFNVFKKMKGK